MTAVVLNMLNTLRTNWLLDSLSACFIGVDLQGNIRYFNQAACVLFATDNEKVQGHSLIEFMRFTDAESKIAISDQLAELAADAEIVELDCQKSGIPSVGEMGVRVSPVLNCTDELVGYSLLLTAESRKNVPAVVDARQVDPLTGLMGRGEFERRLDNMVGDALVSSRTHALLHIDIDQFKIINDTSGHVAGDNLIKLVGQRLKDDLFVGDVLCRLGGDEFGVILSNVDVIEAKSLAASLIKSIHGMNYTWSGIPHRISVSISVVLIDESAKDRASVMSQADVAMYTAKESGRGCIHVYDAQDVRVSSLYNDMDWVSRINEALAQDQFCLVTEQIIELEEAEGGSTVFNELLVRMRYEGKILSPGQFMPAAERFGLMPQIDRWVISTFFTYLQKNAALNQQNVMYSINISGQSLCQESFMEFVYEQLQLPTINPRIICFEITETIAITNFAQVVEFIARVHALGAKFALDDFGTGMSSFGYLQELPVDFVKIDGIFVHDMDENPIHRAMVRSINDVSHVLGKRTIAEYVERTAIVDQLKSLGVDFAQGHLHGKPQALVDIPSTH